MGQLKMIHITPGTCPQLLISSKGSILRDYAQEEGTDVLWFDEESGAAMIARERQRQVEMECWTASHDDQWCCDELTAAAVTYIYASQVHEFLDDPVDIGWPWDLEWFKPFKEKEPENSYEDRGSYEVNRIRCLEKAGALIAAEIDRLKRIQSTPPLKESSDE